MLIIDSDNHPRTGHDVWGCRHHALASIGGVKLQTQRYDHPRPAAKPKPKEGGNEEVGKDEVAASKVKEGVKIGKKNVKSIRRKKKDAEEEGDNMYDRIKKNVKKK